MSHRRKEEVGMTTIKIGVAYVVSQIVLRGEEATLLNIHEELSNGQITDWGPPGSDRDSLIHSALNEYCERGILRRIDPPVGWCSWDVGPNYGAFQKGMAE